MSYIHQFVFGIYPYIALSVFLFGSLMRFEREQYSWKSESSQLLHQGQLRLGNILFHVGILGLFFGHLFGMLTPVAVWDALGHRTWHQTSHRHDCWWYHGFDLFGRSHHLNQTPFQL